jgi:hypothetical protein
MPVQPESKALAKIDRQGVREDGARRFRGDRAEGAAGLRRNTLRDGAQRRRLAAQLGSEIDNLGVDLACLEIDQRHN